MHHPNCIRNDGDWFCVPACRHEEDEALRERIEQAVLDVRLRDACKRALALVHTHDDGTHEPNILTKHVGEAFQMIQTALEAKVR